MSMSALHRLSPHELPVANIGYLAAKSKWMRWPNGGTDFSLGFIFGGPGLYKIFGKTWTITPPCVFTTWPGVPMEFGPNTGSVWEEFYICYDTARMPILTRRRLACKERPIWPIYNPASVRHGLTELCQRLENLHTYGLADRIDRLCDMLLTDTLITYEIHLMPDEVEQLIRAIETHIAAHIAETIDFDALARQHGLSPTHFRRLWQRFFTIPPTHYVLQKRMQAACRFLTETNLRINEIAERLGFKDPLYFSKQFHRLIGRTASDYRGQQGG